MRFPELLRGTLVRRYKRFLADVRLEDGNEITVHCANSGSMLDVAVPGRPVLLSTAENKKRKLQQTWELIHLGKSWVGVNTALPNHLVAEAIDKGRIPELTGYDDLRREVPYSKNSRIDILLTHPERPDCYVEVKNTTLADGDTAMFPDSETVRGQKHLRDLRERAEAGDRAVIFFWIYRKDCVRFRPAEHIDPEYARLLREASAAGVEALAYDANVDRKGVTSRRRIPVEM